MVVCIAQRIACSYFEYGFCIVGLITTAGYLNLIIAWAAMCVVQNGVWLEGSRHVIRAATLVRRVLSLAPPPTIKVARRSLQRPGWIFHLISLSRKLSICQLGKLFTTCALVRLDLLFRCQGFVDLGILVRRQGEVVLGTSALEDRCQALVRAKSFQMSTYRGDQDALRKNSFSELSWSRLWQGFARCVFSPNGKVNLQTELVTDSNRRYRAVKRHRQHVHRRGSNKTYPGHVEGLNRFSSGIRITSFAFSA
jgi:hypothetical protein